MTSLVSFRFSGAPVSVEDFVVLALSRNQSLSAKGVFSDIKRHGFGVTYQAVHKKLKELTNEKVLIFEGQKYKINREWILNSRSFLDNLDLEMVKSAEKVEKKEAVCLSFDSYTDFAGHMLREFAKERDLEPGGICTTCQRHFYWIFSIGKADYDLLKKLGGSGKSYIVCEGKALLDKLLSPIYKKFGWKVVTGITYSENYDLVVYQDWIHQIFFSKEQKRFIEKVCKKIKKPEELTTEFHRKYFENRGKIKVIIFKDKELALQLRADALRHFKGK